MIHFYRIYGLGYLEKNIWQVIDCVLYKSLTTSTELANFHRIFNTTMVLRIASYIVKYYILYFIFRGNHGIWTPSVLDSEYNKVVAVEVKPSVNTLMANSIVQTTYESNISILHNLDFFQYKYWNMQCLWAVFIDK